MKVNSIQQQNFRGKFTDRLAETIVKHPKAITAITGLASCSVIAQKLVMSAGEVTIAPAVDIGVGKAITAITGEKDGRTNQSSKVQAIRTIAQTVGGTMTGVVIRAVCIAGATILCAKAGKKAGSKVAEILTDSNLGKINPKKDAFKYQEKMASWGRNIGGAAATVVMMFTNFVLDAPLINLINKKISPLFGMKIEEHPKAKEVK